MITKQNFADLRDDLQAVRVEIGRLLFAVVDATKEKPGFTRDGNCIAGAQSAADALATLDAIGARVNELEDAALAPVREAAE
jgi:hypothetical protein